MSEWEKWLTGRIDQVVRVSRTGDYLNASAIVAILDEVRVHMVKLECKNKELERELKNLVDGVEK